MIILYIYHSLEFLNVLTKLRLDGKNLRSRFLESCVLYNVESKKENVYLKIIICYSKQKIETLFCKDSKS